MNDTPRLLTLRATALKLHVEINWLRKQAELGAVPGLRAGDRWLFDVASVARVLQARAATLPLATTDTAAGGSHA